MNYKNVNKELLDRIKGYSREEHKAIMSAIQIAGREPSVQISLALFRDALVFQEMAKSTIYTMRLEIDELKKRVEELEVKSEHNET
jgi:hypothetical protein